MNFIRKHSDIVVLASLWSCILRTIFLDVISTYVLSLTTYLGIGGVVILTILKFIISRKHLKISIGTFLLLGCFGLVTFTPISFQLYKEFGGGNRFELSIGFFSVILLCFLVAINLDAISTMHKTQEGIEEKQDPQTQGYLEKYYTELKKKDDSYLLNIIATKERWQKEYIQAAEKLLEERK